MNGTDAVVIGAGAAGIAAARMLHDAGLDVLLVEASNRIGGRARSTIIDGMSVDLGCGWLHSAGRNPWVGLAERNGMAIDRTPANWNVQWRDLGFSPAEQAAFGMAWERWEAAAHAAVGGPDRPLSDFIAQDDPWRPMIDAISGYVNGAPLSAVSLHDWAAYEDASTDDNWAMLDGYGTLVARHGAALPMRLATPVRRIDHRGTALRIETDAGTIETARAIVCVPTPVLADEELVFDPPLPDKHAAAAALPLGLADKLFLRVDGIALPHNGHLIGNPHGARTASYRLSPFGQPLIECFFGGDCAEELELMNDDAVADFAIGELAALLGSDWRARLAPLARTRWRHEPHIRGSYSHARVGSAGARALLAASCADRLFFAGEACSRQDFSTAHGAYQTGMDAAAALLGSRGGRR